MISSRTLLVFVVLGVFYSNALDLSTIKRFSFYADNVALYTTNYEGRNNRYLNKLLINRFQYAVNSINTKYDRYTVFRDPFKVSVKNNNNNNENVTWLNDEDIKYFYFLLPVAPFVPIEYSDSVFIYLKPFEVFGNIASTTQLLDYDTTEQIFNRNLELPNDVVKVVIFRRYNKVFSYTTNETADITNTTNGNKLLSLFPSNYQTEVMKPDDIICPLKCQGYIISQKPFTSKCITPTGYTPLIPSVAELFRYRLRLTYQNLIVYTEQVSSEIKITENSLHILDVHRNTYISDGYIIRHYNFLRNISTNNIDCNLLATAVSTTTNTININEYTKLIYRKDHLSGTRANLTTVQINDHILFNRFEDTANLMKLKYDQYVIYTDPFRVTGYIKNGVNPLSKELSDNFNFIFNVIPHPHYLKMDTIFIYLNPFDVFGEIDNKMYKLDFNTSELFRFNYNLNEGIIKIVIFTHESRVYAYSSWTVDEITEMDVGKMLINITGHHINHNAITNDGLACPLYCQNYDIIERPFNVKCDLLQSLVTMDASFAELFRTKPRYGYSHKNIVLVENYKRINIMQNPELIFVDPETNTYIHDPYLTNHYQFLSIKNDYIDIMCKEPVDMPVNRPVNNKSATLTPTTTTTTTMILHTTTMPYTTTMSLSTTMPHTTTKSKVEESIADIKLAENMKLEAALTENDKHIDTINSKIKIIIILSVVISIIIVTVIIAVLVYVFFIKKSNPKIKIETKLLETLM